MTFRGAGRWESQQYEEAAAVIKAHPQNLLVIGEVGDGSLYCLDLDQGEEPPVGVCEPSRGETIQKQRNPLKETPQIVLNCSNGCRQLAQ
jgi:hypothetical protein